ncbi:hypothetical protein GQ457_11G027280 [Hibiscus cannabinus]
MSEGSPVGAHVIKMMGYIQTLEKLGFALNDELATDVVLQSLPDSFSQFILNFNMNEIEKTFPPLLGMLRTAEGNLKKGGSKSILMVREAKGKGKGKGKKVAKSKGIGKTGHWKRNCLIYLKEVKKAKAVGASVSDQVEPKTYQEVVASPDSEKWLEAMRSEMDSMSENQVWTLVEPPEGIKPIGCKWVFKKKTDMDGNVQTYKGRLVAKGFRQIHGVDYDETFSPVGMFKSIRILLAVAAFHDYEIWKMDVKTAFLNGKLEEDVYMTQPEGFVTPENARKNKVFVARTGVFLEKEFLSNKGKGINIELKEVQQQQVHELELGETHQVVEENSTDLETHPLRRSTRERHEPERYGFLVTTHGDVILVDQDEPKIYQEAVASPDSEKRLKAMRSEMYSMSENQVQTLVEPPEGVKPIGCKWVFKKKTDMDGNVQTYKGQLVAKGFRQIDGVDYDETFSHVAMCKSIRILLAVAAFHDYQIWQMDVKTSFLNGKLEEDVYMTQLKGFVTPENARKEMFPSTPQEREQMSQIPYASAIGSIMYAMICSRLDLSYALSMTSRYQANPGEGHWITVKNILKYLRRTKDVFLVYGGEEELRIKGDVSWKSSKEDTIADSTTDAEYIAASEAAKEAVWIKKFITGLGVIPSILDVVDLYYRGDVDICKVHTENNIADPLTKPLAQQKHDRHTESLGIRYVSDWS